MWQMASLFRRATLWLHPCADGGTEVFCISGHKAQCAGASALAPSSDTQAVAGAIPVVLPCMALSETIRFGVKVRAVLPSASRTGAIHTVSALPSAAARVRRFECAHRKYGNWPTAPILPPRPGGQSWHSLAPMQ